MSASEMAATLDPVARRVFLIALRDNRAGELLAHLFDGGGVTIDAHSGELVFITPDMLQEAADDT